MSNGELHEHVWLPLPHPPHPKVLTHVCKICHALTQFEPEESTMKATRHVPDPTPVTYTLEMSEEEAQAYVNWYYGSGWKADPPQAVYKALREAGVQP